MHPIVGSGPHPLVVHWNVFVVAVSGKENPPVHATLIDEPSPLCDRLLGFALVIEAPAQPEMQNFKSFLPTTIFYISKLNKFCQSCSLLIYSVSSKIQAHLKEFYGFQNFTFIEIKTVKG